MRPISRVPPEHWARLSSLLDAALDREAIDRSAYLHQACAGEANLQAEVDAMLACAQAPSFLDSTAMSFAAPLFQAGDIDAGSSPLDNQDDELSDFPKGVLNNAGLPYEFHRKLGRGGMATVYLGRDKKHDRWVAVKVLNADLTASIGAQRFVQEIRFAARLQHPHILGLLDSGVFGANTGTLEGRPYYAMPYVDGESLRARVARVGPLTLTEALRVLRELADALAYAHEQGVVHRDIKPENILLSRDHAVVADFGIAKAVLASQSDDTAQSVARKAASGTVTELGTLVGTLAYMSPEQAAANAQVDHRADLYAWGVVAYELLSGRHPFSGKTSRHELLAAHKGEMPEPLGGGAPNVPPSLARLVMRCLAKLPSERPGSGVEILAALDASVIAKGPSMSIGRLSNGRHRMLAALGVMILLGMAVTGARHWKRRDTHSLAAVVVSGTGNPAIDVRAVQTAVDRGGNVILKGHFSFATPPTNPVAPILASSFYPPAAEVVVAKAVTISGLRDARGDIATIDGGTIPFYVDAPGEHVSIRGLHFVRPTADAILVYAARGLEIAFTKVDGLVSFAGGAEGIALNTSGDVPRPASPGYPQNVSGHILISNNDIDASGETPNATSGVMVWSVGQSPNAEADVDVIDNDIRNTTGSMVNIRRVNGRVRVSGNSLRTSDQRSTTKGNDGVRLVNSGSFLMANNRVECRWADAACISVFSQFSEWPMERAVVEDNDVLMAPPAGVVFSDSSDAINVRGFARGNLIRHNRIQGRARMGLAMYVFRGGVPAENTFIDNRFERFKPTLADMFVGSGVVSRRIVGPGTIADLSAGKNIER